MFGTKMEEGIGGWRKCVVKGFRMCMSPHYDGVEIEKREKAVYVTSVGDEKCINNSS
jgi:hypothetical protein